MIKRLAIITTHPVQYNAPLFALLSKRGFMKIKVFYTWGEEVLKKKYDPGFGEDIQWDIPLLENTDYCFVENVAKEKGSHHFKGIDNPALTNKIQEWKADAILVYGWNFKSHLRAMRYFHGKIPVLFRGDSVSLQKLPLLKKTARHILLKWVYGHIDHALYVGTHNKNYFLEAGVPESKLVFAPHAIDNGRFTIANDVDDLASRKKLYGIGENDIVILYAGKLDDNKNVGLAAEAFTKVDHKNLHFVITGNGYKEEFLKTRYAGNKNIHFMPFQNQSAMPQVYRLADIFLLPSVSETWGLGVNEAMACSKAILISDTCGCAIDLVNDGVNGYVFESNSVESLTAKMQLLKDKKVLAEMGRRSLEIIQSFSYEKICVAIEETVGAD